MKRPACRRSFSCREGLRPLIYRQRGATAVMLVIGSLLVMLAISAAVAGQARHELRISKAETESQQALLLIQGGYTLAQQLARDQAWPQTPHTGTYACPPQEPYPSFCVEAKPRSGGTSSYEQIPFRVRYRVNQAAAEGAAYGWVIYDGTVVGQPVTGVRPYHYWCTPQGDYFIWDRDGPCQPGG